MKPENKLSFNPLFLLAIGILAISTGAIFAKLADAPPLVIAAYRVGISSAILLPVAWWKAKDELLKLSVKDFILTSISGFFLALHFAAWISSLSYTTVSNSVVLVNTTPLWVGLLTPLITHDKLKTRMVIGIGLSIVGCIIIGTEDFHLGPDSMWGNLLALTGGICASFYILLGRNLRQKISLMAYISVCYSVSAIMLWSMVFLTGLKFHGFSLQTTAAFWAMALIPQLVGHTSYNCALKWLSAGTIAVSLLGEPIGATILAFIIFGEKITWLKAAGSTFILSAIYISASNKDS